MSSPTLPTRGILRKIQSFNNKNRVFRVAVIGQKGVGKSALTVRFLTRRFIGDYDSTLERTYTCTRCVLGSSVDFEVLDTAGQYENSGLRQHIKWCDAVVLVYSVTDRCSFNEARRLHFTITASCRRRYKAASDPAQELPPPSLSCRPVTLVANQTDREQDRMVSREEGQSLAAELGCVAFTELSVREDVDSVLEVVEDLYIMSGNLTQRKARQLFLQHQIQQTRPPLLSPAAWSVLSLDRLGVLGGGSAGGGGAEGKGRSEGEGMSLVLAASTSSLNSLASCPSSLSSSSSKSQPPSPALRARRREALVS